MSILDNIKEKLQAVVDSGRSVEDLTSADPEYRYVKDAKVIIDGKKLSTEEKFALAGFDRPSKNRDLASYIKNAIIAYRQEGGDFNVDYKDLPFIAEVRSYVNHHNANGPADMTIEDCLRMFGAKEVSKIYKRYHGIMDVKRFTDANGYVDSYRKDPTYYGYISKASAALDMVDGYVVSLIGNQDLQQSFLDVDYISMVMNKVDRYIKMHKENGKAVNLSELHRSNPQLYSQINWVANNFCSFTGENLSRKDVLYVLGIDVGNTSFSHLESEKDREFDSCIAALRTLPYDNEGKISRADMTDKQYKIVKQKAQRLGVYLTELFRIYEIKYMGGLEKERFSKTKVKNLPYIDEMREKRDKAYLQYLDKNAKAPKEIKFENYFKICTDIYGQYKDKIVSFGIDKEKE